MSRNKIEFLKDFKCSTCIFLKKLAVDGVDIRHSSHELAVATIRSASDKMKLLVQSLQTGVVIF